LRTTRPSFLRNRTIHTWTPPTIRPVICALALALAFAFCGVARAEDGAAQPAAAVDELPPDQSVSDTVVELAGWVVATKDNHGYPFIIMDKAAAQVLVFGPDGRLRGAAPGLFGSAIGDHTVAGIAGMALRDIPAKDRTTPAGRFVGGFGPSIGGGRTLWVDYDSAVALHALSDIPAEKRDKRLGSPTPDDNRITNGCINVSPAFFETVISPTFQAGGLFYVLPDAAPLAEAFPGFVRSNGTSPVPKPQASTRRAPAP
jgi:hypothetical protein